MDPKVKERLPMLVLFFGAFISVFAFCFPWIIYETGYVPISISGMEFLTQINDMKEILKATYDSDWQVYVPICILCLSFIAAIVSALPVLGAKVDKQIHYAALISIGAIMLILLLAYSLTTASGESWFRVSLGAIGGVGFQMSFIISLFPIFVGVLGLMGALAKKDSAE